MVVMDQYSRKIIGMAVHQGDLCGVTICVMFNQLIVGQKIPKYLSMDNDPLFNFHRFQANLRIMDIEAIRSIPGVPQSHPFIESLIGTIRFEFTDNILFLNEID